MAGGTLLRVLRLIVPTTDCRCKNQRPIFQLNLVASSVWLVAAYPTPLQKHCGEAGSPQLGA